MDATATPFKPPLTHEQRRRRARLGAFLFRVFALLCLVGSWFVIDHVNPQVSEGIESLGWTHTRGVILDAGRGWKRVTTDDGDSHEAWLRLWYAYEVPAADGPRFLDGQRYDVSTDVHDEDGMHSGSMATIGMARACLAGAPEIDVYYDPTDPSRAVVSPGIPYGTGFWIVVLTGLLIGALWLLRAARAVGNHALSTTLEEPYADEPFAQEPVPDAEPEETGTYVKDAHGEYWRDDDVEPGDDAAPGDVDESGEQGEVVDPEFASDDELAGLGVQAAAAPKATPREAHVLAAVLAGVFVPVGGIILMATLAYFWEMWIGGVAPVEIVLVYAAVGLLLAAFPKLSVSKAGLGFVMASGCLIPTLGGLGLAFLAYEDATDSDVRHIRYVPEETWVIDQMRSEHPLVRRNAVRVAGARQEFQEAQPLILELLDDPDPEVRKSARHAAYRRRLPLPRKR